MNKDLLTGEKIKGKDAKTREFTLFNCRKNMLSYYKENANDKDSIRKLSLNLIDNYRKLNKFQFTPSTVELRFNILPTVQLLKKFGLNYEILCNELLLKKKFDYVNQFELNDGKYDIWQDTREQKPINFKNISKKTSLAFGDYISPSKPNICIERKSLLDLVGTISQGYDRFKSELSRAKSSGVYVFILVETNLSQSLSFNYLPQMRFVQATPKFIFGRINHIYQNFDNCQFVFCKGRGHLSEVSDKIFRCENPQVYDWEYIIETQKI